MDFARRIWYFISNWFNLPLGSLWVVLSHGYTIQRYFLDVCIFIFSRITKSVYIVYMNHYYKGG